MCGFIQFINEQGRRMIWKAAGCCLLVWAMLTHPAEAEEATYSGRTFADWKVLAEKDLNPQTRTEALEAIGVLGRHGHREEAIELIMAVIDHEQETVVLDQAYVSLLNFQKAAAEIMASGLSNKNRIGRVRVMAALSQHFLIADDTIDAGDRELAVAVIPGLMASFARTFDKPRKPNRDTEVTPRLVKKLESEYRRALGNYQELVQERHLAADLLYELLNEDLPDDLLEDVSRTLLVAAKSPDIELALPAITLIGGVGKHAKPAIPLLIEEIQNGLLENRGGNFFGGGGYGGGGYGAGSLIVLRPRTDSIRSHRPRTTTGSQAAVDSIIRLGPIAKETKPTLEAIVKQAKGSFYQSCVDAICAIDGEE